ncbi:MAG: phytoene/squalene synthase family protein [Gammaproteobacteria bacterium]|nr:phytoene/squalene synthase family protein [Gammaproteobacteria bacterium]
MNSLDHSELVDTSRLIIKQGSKSFATAAKLFDEGTRDNAYMLYAWCRYCDDVIDNQELGFNSQPQAANETQRILDDLKEKTQAAIDNKPSDDPIFEGLRYVLKANDIPGRYPLELLEGFAMDAADHQYKTFEETLQYCYYVAGVVGVMMAYVMGTRDEGALQRATDLGIAFQLTNISRDIREDALIGRVYLPEAWLTEAGIPADDLINPKYSKALMQVVERMLAEGDRYYASADQGLRSLGFRSAWAVAAARGVYKAIGDKVRENGESALVERVVVRKRRKLLGVVEGMLDAFKASIFHKRSLPIPRDSDLWTAPSIH